MIAQFQEPRKNGRYKISSSLPKDFQSLDGSSEVYVSYLSVMDLVFSFIPSIVKETNPPDWNDKQKQQVLFSAFKVVVFPYLRTFSIMGSPNLNNQFSFPSHYHTKHQMTSCFLKLNILTTFNIIQQHFLCFYTLMFLGDSSKSSFGGERNALFNLN